MELDGKVNCHCTISYSILVNTFFSNKQLHKANAENKEEVLVEKAKIQSVKKKFGTLRSNLDVETVLIVASP